VIGKAAVWSIRLTAAAAEDLDGIADWTVEHFGPAQARVYTSLLNDAIEALANGPRIPGVRPRGDVGRGLFTLHAARGTRKAHHFILFRVGRSHDGGYIEVLRVLHDAMDLPRHLPPA